MWHLHKYFWDEDNWILWGELFMSQIIIPVFRRPGFPHSADVTFSTTNTDPYSTRWFFDGCENINASAAPSSIFLLIHPQYVLSTIINVPFVLLKKEIIFPLLPNNIYFHHHYFFPLFHPQYFLDCTINISLAPHQYSFWLFFLFPPSEFLGQYHQYFPCSTIYIQCNNFPIPLSLSATISWLMNCDCVFSRSSCKYFCIISHKTLRNHALDSHTRLHYVFNCFRK